jgi:hypothetical protein
LAQIAGASTTVVNRDAVLPLIASAVAHGPVGVARPKGFERAPPTIVIEGVDELVAALRAA